MSLRGTGGLFSIVSKEIRKKHLEQDIKYAENRGKSRSCKLKDHYQVPQSNNRNFYLYSNIHGNQFILRQQSLQGLEIESREEAATSIQQLHGKINTLLYELWIKKKQFSRSAYFSQNQRGISISTFLIIIMFFLACLAQPAMKQLFSNQVYARVEKYIFKAILSFILLLLAICGFLLMQSLNRDYEAFNYDKEAVKMLVGYLREWEERLQTVGFKVDVDKEMTWIRFRVTPNINAQISEDSQEQQEMPNFMQYNRSNSVRA